MVEPRTEGGARDIQEKKGACSIPNRGSNLLQGENKGLKLHPGVWSMALGDSVWR